MSNITTNRIDNGSLMDHLVNNRNALNHDDINITIEIYRFDFQPGIQMPRFFKHEKIDIALNLKRGI